MDPDICLQGPPFGFDIMYLALADRNKQVRFGLGILSRGNLTYDPLIWSKVTSLSSTASKRKDVKNQENSKFLMIEPTLSDQNKSF